MQAVDGKALVVDCREELRDTHTFNVRLCAKFEARQFHINAAPDTAAKSVCGEIRNLEATFIEAIGSGAAQSALVQDVVVQVDFGTGKSALACQFAAGKSPFTAQIHFTDRGEGRAQCLAKVGKADPAAIAVFPLRRLEIGHFGLQINSRSAHGELPLFDGESVAPKSEFSGSADGQRDKTFLGEGDAFPIEVPGVERMIEAASGIEVQSEVAALQCQRSLSVVVEDPSIGKFQTADAQIKKSFACWFGGNALHDRDIRGAVFFDAKMKMWFADNDVGERNLTAPDGVNVQAGVDFFGREKRFGAVRLGSVNY